MRIAAAAGATLAALTIMAGCGAALPEAMDPLDPGRDAEIGLPVLGYLWERTVHDRSWDSLPQEFAEAAVDRQITGDFVYVGSQGGILYSLRASDGKQLWSQKVGPTSSRPLVYRGRIYLGTDEGSMICIDTYDGEIKWRYQTKGAILHAPVLVGDMVIFANDIDHIYALDADSGKWRWGYERETPDEDFTHRGHAGVTAHGDRVYTGFADGHVVALSAATGEVVWVRSLAGEKTQFVSVDTTPVLHDGVLYAASASGGLYAIDPADGTERWRLAIEGAGQVAIDGDRLYVAAAEAGLHAVDLGGHVIWRQGLARAGDPARPAISGDYLFLSASEAGMFVVDKRNGELLQHFDPGSGVSAEPTLLGDQLYVVSNGGVLYALVVRQFENRR